GAARSDRGARRRLERGHAPKPPAGGDDATHCVRNGVPIARKRSGAGRSVRGPKLKVVANTTVKLAACFAKAVNKGLPLDSTSTCLADTDEKCLRDIAKAEAKGPCDVSGNTPTIETALARFI